MLTYPYYYFVKLHLIPFNVTAAKISIIGFSFFFRIFSDKKVLHFIFLGFNLSDLRKSLIKKRSSWLNGLISEINTSKKVQNNLLLVEALGKKQTKEFINDRIKWNRTSFDHIISKNTQNIFLAKTIKEAFCEGQGSNHSSWWLPVCKTTCNQRKKRHECQRPLCCYLQHQKDVSTSQWSQGWWIQ